MFFSGFPVGYSMCLTSCRLPTIVFATLTTAVRLFAAALCSSHVPHAWYIGCFLLTPTVSDENRVREESWVWMSEHKPTMGWGTQSNRYLHGITWDTLLGPEAGWATGFSRSSSPREPVPLARPHFPKATTSPNHTNSWGPDVQTWVCGPQFISKP